MAGYLSLPRLQIHLHGLRGEQTLAVSAREIERIFGHNDMAERRLSRFAKSHKCIIAHTDNCVVFQKMD
jgi:hypothetical protein